MKKSLLFLFLLPLSLFAQTARPSFSLSVTTVAVGDCAASTVCTKTFTVTNSGTTSINVVLSGLAAPFSASPQSFSLGGSAVQTVTVSFSPTFNLSYNDILVVDAAVGLNPKAVPVTGRGKYTDANNYYAGTEDLWGTALRNLLATKVTTGHSALGYTEGRNRMFSTTIDGINGNASSRQLECVYTGRLVTLANGSPRPNASAPDYMNTEHTWPQGYFNSADPMVSDIHHLFPTDADANNERGNFAFGIATNRATARCNDMDIPSQNGTCTNQGAGTWSYLENSKYEVREVQKGNTARAMMYFITRYPVNYSSFYTSAQEAVFKQWHLEDPPNAKDVVRNTGVQNAQGNRNPYVDHPDFINRIGTFIGGTLGAAPQTALATHFPSAEGFGNVQINTNLEADILVANKGTQAISITAANITGDGFSVVSGGTATLNTGETHTVKVRFMPTVLNQTYSGSLSILTSAGTFNTTLSGLGALTTPTETENPQEFILTSVYPNPFANVSEVKFLLYQPENVTLTLVDMLGRVVYQQNAALEVGENTLPIDATNLSNGIYIAALNAGAQQRTFKVTVLK